MWEWIVSRLFGYKDTVIEKLESKAELKYEQEVYNGITRILKRICKYHIPNKSQFGIVPQDIILKKTESILGCFENGERIKYDTRYQPDSGATKIRVYPASNEFEIHTVTYGFDPMKFIEIDKNEMKSYPALEITFIIRPKGKNSSLSFERFDIELTHELDFGLMNLLKRFRNLPEHSVKLGDIIENFIPLLEIQISRGHTLNPINIKHDLSIKISENKMKIILKVTGLNGHIIKMPEICLTIPKIMKLRNELRNEIGLLSRPISHPENRLDKLFEKYLRGDL